MHILRQAEVENLGVPSLRDEYVGGFDVTMNDALAVSSIEGVGNLDGNRDNTLGIQGACGDQVFQGHPVQVLHRNEWFTIVLPDFIRGADVWMVQCRG